MNFLYDISVKASSGIYKLYARFNRKAAQWAAGQKGLMERIEREVDPRAVNIWFHAASLGEFEQGRPVIEAYKKAFPDHKIVLTFFSPSGYEIRKNYPGADHIFYLPPDTATNARRFLKAVNPKKAVFIKYELWHNYLKLMAEYGIDCSIISAIFMPEHGYFKWYGSYFRKDLKYVSKFFVQNKLSEKLLNKAGITAVEIAGDTRFDRVYEIAEGVRSISLIESFAGDSKVFIAGSTWPKDEELLVKLINERTDMKFIIAPHEIHTDRIDRMIDEIKRPSARYTKASDTDDMSQYEVLFIDTIGILSSVYQYGRIAYIGGGFGVGIHNILEAATFGLPLIFGPNYSRFAEANDLIARKGAEPITCYSELKDAVANIDADYTAKSDICKKYVAEKRGATEQIMRYLSNNR